MGANERYKQTVPTQIEQCWESSLRWGPPGTEEGLRPAAWDSSFLRPLTQLAETMGKYRRCLVPNSLEGGKEKKCPRERLRGRIINVLLRRKILLCVAQHANTSTNKMAGRKQVELQDFSHKD